MVAIGINERQVALRKGGNYTHLDNYLDRLVCKRSAWSEANYLDAADATFQLVPTARIALRAGESNNVIAASDPAANNGVLLTSANAGVIAATGTLGSALITIITDNSLNVLNLMELRDRTSHQPITVEDGRTVYGLLHTDATDGQNHSESNLQITYVYVASNGVMTPVNINTAVEFRFARAFQARSQDPVSLLDGARDREVIQVDPGVTSLNIDGEDPFTGDVNLKPGTGITFSEDNGDLVISAEAAEGFKINEITDGQGDIEGSVTFVPGDGISLTQGGTGGDVVEIASTINVVAAEGSYAPSTTIDAETNIAVTNLGSPEIPADYATNMSWEFFLNGVRLRKGALSGGAEIERMDASNIQLAYTLDDGDVLEYKQYEVVIPS